MTDSDDDPFDIKPPPERVAPLAVPGVQDESEAIFVTEYATHGDALLAIVRAGITDPRYPIEHLAQRMLDREDIQVALRVMDKAKARSEPLHMTRESVLAELQDVFQKAVNSHRLNDAINAKRLQAQMMGWLVERKEITFRKGVDDLSDAELEEIARRGQQEQAIRSALPVPYEELPNGRVPDEAKE